MYNEFTQTEMDKIMNDSIKDTKTLSEAADNLVEKTKKLDYTEFAGFCNTIPYTLSNLLNLFDISSHVNKEKIEQLASHRKLTGGPREYFLITINSVELDLTISQIHALATNKKLLESFVNNYNSLILEMDKIKNAYTDNSYSPGFGGSAFYSDISLKLDQKFKKSASAF